MTGRRHAAGLLAWIGFWGLAFGVSALLARVGLHGTAAGFWIIVARDAVFGTASLLAWSKVCRPSVGVLAAPRRFEWPLLAIAVLLTVAYLDAVHRTGPRAVDSGMLFALRRYELPVRILTFVGFQQAAVTLLLLDWNRRWLSERRAIALTTAIFSLSHLGAVTFHMSPLHALLLTVLSAAAMAAWGHLRLAVGAAWTPGLMHYLFYIALCLRFARQPI